MIQQLSGQLTRDDDSDEQNIQYFNQNLEPEILDAKQSPRKKKVKLSPDKKKDKTQVKKNKNAI